MRARVDSAATARSVALVAVMLALSLAAAVGVLEMPPWPREAGAPAGIFSAERAMRHVERLAREPRPLGSTAHARARIYLLDQLRELGLEAEVQTGVGLRQRAGRIVGAQVHNVVGRLRGSGAGDAVLLVAHYDSRSNTPGAGDDASGVATILELLRARRSTGEAAVNDLLVLFADAEEIGLFGARIFAAEHRWAADARVVLNFEARGRNGRSLMFETGPGSAGTVPVLGSSSRPSASSLSADVYRRMPNDTDFSAFRDRGLPGLNFAFIGDLSAYHSSLDTPGRLSRSSLQHQGEQGLAALRELADADLDALGRAGEAVFFDVAGRRLVTYPTSWAVPMAVLPLLLFVVWALGAGREESWIRGLVAWVAGLTGGASAGWLFWIALERFAPGFLRSPYGLPYDTILPFASLVVLAFSAASLVYGAGRARAGDLGLASGTVLGWAFLGLAAAWFLPGGSHLFLWPALVAVGVLFACRRLTGSARLALLIVPVVPAVVLWSPVARLLTDSLTLRAAPVICLAVALPLGLLAPHLGLLSERSPVAKALGLAVVAVGMTTVAIVGDRPDPETPRVSALFQLVDADSGVATWLSPDESPGSWVTGILGPGAERGAYPDLLPAGPDAEVLRAAAGAPSLPPPEADLVADEEDDGSRRLTLRLRSRRGAPTLRVVASAIVQIGAVTVAGRRLEIDDPSAPVDLTFYGLPASGVEVGLEMLDRQPVEMKLLDRTWGLPEDTPRRPPDTIPSTSWWSDTVWVGRTVWQ